MRHIPEDELHAYLDQGLSRTQCVEIESHLAACPSCQATRDGIAALRDRTTALLARLAPQRGVPPAFEVLRKRAAELASQRRRRLHQAAWAASLVRGHRIRLGGQLAGAVRRAGAAEPADPGDGARGCPGRLRRLPRRAGAGGAGYRPRAGPCADSGAHQAGAGRLAGAGEPAPKANLPSPESVLGASRAAALSVLNPTPALELTSASRPARQGDIELDGMWRTMSWDGAKAEAGERLPHIDGLPVVQVQVQSGDQGSRPVMVVAQQLSSGQVIRTIEGPASDVSQLLSRGSIADVDSLFLPRDSGGRGPDAGHAMAMQFGDRMLAITGDLPADSLRAMIRRLNAEMRGK